MLSQPSFSSLSFSGQSNAPIAANRIGGMASATMTTMPNNNWFTFDTATRYNPINGFKMAIAPEPTIQPYSLQEYVMQQPNIPMELDSQFMGVPSDRNPFIRLLMNQQSAYQYGTTITDVADYSDVVDNSNLSQEFEGVGASSTALFRGEGYGAVPNNPFSQNYRFF